MIVRLLNDIAYWRYDTLTPERYIPKGTVLRAKMYVRGLWMLFRKDGKPYNALVRRKMFERVSDGTGTDQTRSAGSDGVPRVRFTRSRNRVR